MVSSLQVNSNSIDKHRAPRSYVLRRGRVTPGQQKALETLWLRYGLSIEQGILNLDKVFGRSAPRILEIGFGMGHSLFDQIQQYPDHDFIGIEVYPAGIGSLLNKIQDHPASNLRIFRADAIDVLNHSIPDNSIDCVQLFFPDPWPKKRHHKRRLVQLSFIKLIWYKLKPQGRLHMVTDWDDYAQHMQKVMSMTQGFVEISGESPLRSLTKFEKRGLALGHQIHDLFYTKEELSQ